MKRLSKKHRSQTPKRERRPASRVGPRQGHEQQAQEAARRVLGGAQQVARRLSPVPAAAYHVPASRPEPLPAALQTDLETGFGADLSAVRIHRDAAAAAATGREQANAFAAGRHIFFNAGAYAPHSESGRELIAHEVAHVLQQTGRATAGGRMRATAVEARGEIQRADDEFVENAVNYDLFKGGATTWSEIKEAYKDVADFTAHAAIIDGFIPPTFPLSPDQIDALAAKTEETAFQAFSDEIKGLYVDALKLVGGYEAARKVLVANPDIPTSFRSQYFYNHVREKSLGWMYKVAVNHPFAKNYYPWRFIASYRIFFTSPGAPVVDLDAAILGGGDGSFKKLLLAELRAVKEKEGLLANELQAMMLFALYYLDDGRHDRLPMEIEAVRGENDSLVEAQRDVALRYAQGTAEKRSPLSFLPEVKTLFGSAFPHIQKLADRAATYWNRILAFQAAFAEGAGYQALNAAEVKAIAEGIKTDDTFKNLPGVLLTTAKRLFARPKGNLLSAKTFADRVEQQRSALQAAMGNYGRQLSRLFRKDKEGEHDALRFGLAMAILADAEQVLRRYDKSQDASFSKKKMADQRIATRLRLADTLLDIAVLFDWDDLRDTANGVFLEGLQIALLTDWEADPEVEFGDLTREMGPEIQGYEGTKISGALLDQFLYTQYFKNLSTELARILSERGAIYTNEMPILTEALKEADNKTKRPRRFIVQQWEVGSPEEAEIKGPNVTVTMGSFADVIFVHAQTKALLKDQKQPDELALAPIERLSSDRPLFIWLVPRIDAFFEMITQLPVIRKAVTAHWKLKHGEDESPPDPMGNLPGWVDAFEALVQDLNLSDEPEKKELLEKIGAAISGAVEAEFLREESYAHQKAREAVTHQRKVLVDNYLKPTLKGYDRFDRRHWRTPGLIFKAIGSFARFVWPPEDQLLQVSALVLEIAPELMAAFGPVKGLLGTAHERRFDIMDTVSTLTWGAVRQWEEGQADPADVASGKASALNPITAISDLPQSELQARVDIARTLRDSLTARVVAQQKRFGLRAKKESKSISSIYIEDEGMTLIKWGMEKTSLSQGDRFLVYGTDYQIIDVHETFIFNPGFGQRETLGVNWPDVSRPGDALLLDGSGNPMKASGRTLITVLRTKKHKDPELVTITDTDTGKLTWFSTVLGEHFAFEYIRGAGVVIETAAEAVMEVLEFVPGVGQAVATARFVSAILSTITSEEVHELLDAFSEDGFAAFEDIFDSLTKVVEVEELANVLLFDADFTTKTKENSSLRAKKDRQEKISRRGGTWSRMARLLKNVIEIGVRVLDRLKQLSKRVQAPVRAAQLWILSHPAANLILGLIVRGFDVLSSLSLGDLAQSAEELGDKDWEQMIKDATNDAAQNVANRGRDMLDMLRSLEMPEEVIPLEWVVDFVIDLAVNALSAKYRKGVKAVRGVLRTLGLWEKVTSAISDGLMVAGVDPNKLYRGLVRDKLGPWFATTRDTFAGELTSLFKEVPFLDAITKPAGTPVTLDFSGLGFPEAEGFGASREAERPGDALSAAALGSVGNGRPLPQSLRLRAEGGFGHNFGHVRLHRGQTAARFTKSFRAEALTSGSHVFMRPGLDPQGAFGRRVLHHELAHVVQQTGPRPLNRPHISTPTLGQPGRGLSWNAGREEAAERAADRTTDGQISPQPLAVGGRTQGIQPAFTKKFLRKFLSRLSDPGDIVDVGEELEKEKKKKVELDAESQAVANALGPELKSWVAKKSTFEAPFSSVHTELKSFVEAVWPEFEAAIPLLVARSILTVSPPKKTGIEHGQEPYLPPDNLQVELERMLYSLTSMAFVVELRGKKGPETVKRREIVDKKNPVKDVDVVYVHLPLLEENETSEKLWDLLVKNSFKGTPDYSKATHDSFKAATKLVIGRGGPSPDTYLKSQFKLSSRRAKVIRNQRDRLVTFTGEGDEWPSVTEYVATIGASDIGLRLGTYATWGPGTKGIEDRDAHHIVQYLLFEYFRNVKTKQPFPLLGSVAYPGVDNSGKEVKAISGSGGRIDVDTYYPGRGGEMPTIYISRHAHQSNIHYRSEPPDDGKIARKSQGATVDNTFRTELGDDYAKIMEDASLLGQLAVKMKEKKVHEPVGPQGTATTPVTVDRVQNAIFKAAQSTYKDMWKYMKPRLKRALNNQELHYYNAIADLRSMPRVKDSDMNEPFRIVAKRSEDEIGTTAGFGPGYSP